MCRTSCDARLRAQERENMDGQPGSSSPPPRRLPIVVRERLTHPMAWIASWHCSITFMTSPYSPSRPVPSEFECSQSQSCT